MRVVFDINIFISAMLTKHHPPFKLIQAWLEKNKFDIFTSEEQFDEMRHITRSDKIRPFIHPSEAGQLINRLRLFAHRVNVSRISITLSPDPADNFLLAIARSAQADYLVTGDKGDLLKLKRFERTHIVTARKIVTLLKL